MGIFPNFWDENLKSLWNHHLDFLFKQPKTSRSTEGFSKNYTLNRAVALNRKVIHIRNKENGGKYHWGCESHHPRTSFVQ